MKLFRSAICISLLILAFQPTYSTHIVGGEIELTHLSGSSYKLALILYFDQINGNPGALDNSVSISSFSKRTHQQVGTFILPLVSTSSVAYSYPDCSIPQLRTQRIYYERTIQLPPGEYNEAEGYYMVFERCCRNGVIQNIFDPGGAGQSFYLEFPAVVQGGQAFINSSPRLFPPLSDYACLNQPFYFDFSGDDPDGDSLVYSMAIPINGHSTPDSPAPPPSPAPYSLVQFLSGYNLENMIKGEPPISINQQGFITITPTETGLFVFSVKVEEYRDGKKIGEVRRDFQMLVIDCPQASPPEIIKVVDKYQEEYHSGKSITYQANETDNCFHLTVRDEDANTRLVSKIIANNFPENDLVFSGDLDVIIHPEDSAQIQVCLTECPTLINEEYSFKVLVGDNSCSLPMFDTVEINLFIELPNHKPEVHTDLDYDEDLGCYYGEFSIDELSSFEIFAEDSDLDSIWLQGKGVGFDLTQLGISFQNTQGKGTTSSQLSWTPTCATLGTGISEKLFEFEFITSDIGRCGIISQDTACVQIKVFKDPIPNERPKLQINALPVDMQGRYFNSNALVGKSLRYEIIGSDEDNDQVEIIGLTPQYIFDSLGISFQGASGPSPQVATFEWTPTCDFLNEDFSPKEYEFDFLISDQTYCDYATYDTLTLRVTVTDLSQIEIRPFPNAFTPNNDGKSDVFKISNLPIDNCRDSFKHIQIYNRWGEDIFYSEERNFEWDGRGFPPGIYYYSIEYNNAHYKGTISIVGER
ncbi:gliding motility-associated C-terminal domain-containing protein [Rapidithrix thailandica]|uniref:Gliding motility-associated C-terminal domain-containing protein n=1 Tax=Rapidithrix thailandica TaxID=413964 RepID=A0AAW9S1M1_9BACT